MHVRIFALVFVSLLIVILPFQAAISHTAVDTDRFASFHIVYLVDETAASPRLRSAEHMRDSLNATIAYDWQDVLTTASDARIDAFIFDTSSLPEVDARWLSQAYHDGVTIAAFNVDVSTFSALLGDACLDRDAFGTGYGSDYFLIASRLLLSPSAQDAARALQAYESTCGEEAAPDVDTFVMSSVGRSSSFLRHARDFEEFRQLLEAQVRGVLQLRADYVLSRFVSPFVR